MSVNSTTSQPPTIRPTEPEDVIRAFMAAMTTKDYDTAMAYIADDCEYDNVPFAPVRGPAATRAILEPAFAPIIENEFVLRRMAVDGPLVMVERLDRRHFPWGWRELPIAGIFEVHAGKITLWRDYFDRGQFEKAFAPPA